jgi:hypothetical protein
VSRRRLRRRLFWTGVVLVLALIWLTVQVLRVAGAIASAARRPLSLRLGVLPQPRGEVARLPGGRAVDLGGRRRWAGTRP